MIRLNIVTGVEINGPKKKNEINREVRKIVQDQLGVEVAGKPTINFTLAGSELGVPQIASGASAARSEPAMAKSVPPIPPASPRMTTPLPSADEDEVETVHAREDEHRPSGIELARRDALKYGSPVSRESDKPAEPPSGVAPSGEETKAEPSGNSGDTSADG